MRLVLWGKDSPALNTTDKESNGSWSPLTLKHSSPVNGLCWAQFRVCFCILIFYVKFLSERSFKKGFIWQTRNLYFAAMSFPASGLESTYRNSLADVAFMLHQKHGNKYVVFNVSERRYDISKLNNQVICFDTIFWCNSFSMLAIRIQMYVDC